MPSFKNAARHAYGNGLSFLTGAGGVILAISIGLWFLSTFPVMSNTLVDEQIVELRASNPDSEFDIDDELLRKRFAQEYSLLGRAGKSIQPVFEPLGFDWKTSVAVMASFAAREVVVSTLAVLHTADESGDSIVNRIRMARNTDGSLTFDSSTSIALLVFFVLAMQCLPTQAVTKKETGSWGWAILQLVYMTVLACAAAFVAKIICEWMFI